MAHEEQMIFLKMIRNHIASPIADLEIIEIGSGDVNGSIRGIFKGCKSYTGFDLAEGPGVDQLCSGHEIALPTKSIDVAISSECFEHNPVYKETLGNMTRMVKPGGLVVVTCATFGRREHGTTATQASDSPGSQSIGWNYYQNLKKHDILSAINIAANFSDYRIGINRFSCDLYFVGIKAGGGDKLLDMSEFELYCYSQFGQFYRSKRFRAIFKYLNSIEGMLAELLLPRNKFHLASKFSFVRFATDALLKLQRAAP